MRRQSYFQPTAQSGAMQGGDHRLGTGFDPPTQLAQANGLADAAELLVRRTPDGTPTTGRKRAAISALVWDSEGKRLLFGAENGDAGQLTLPV